MKAVIDTNVIVTAFINEHTPPARIIVEWGSQSRFGWITSTRLLAEADRVFARRKVALRTDAAEVVAFLHLLRANATVVQIGDALNVVRDPDDNAVIEAAVAGNADYIVTGDNDLLSMGTYGLIEIVSPARFLALLKSQP